jgi:hypothetical protein
MGAVERFCDRAMVLERGNLTDIGEPRRVAEAYLRLNFSQAERDAAAEEADQPPAEPVPEPDPDAPQRWGDGRARIVDAWFEDAAGERADVLVTGEPCAYAARVRFEDEVVDPLFGVDVHDTEDHHLLAANNVLEPASGRFAPGDEVVFRIRFTNIWSPGRYRASPAVAHGGTGLSWIDRHWNLHTITVISPTNVHALVAPPYDFELVHREAPAAG